ncbi:nucleotide disphospho-sugar-binding domain-containing protein [Saccharothrix deserti]|uniref:nucleotide disphospho-sugar-binding domain-containing protein n=1 Tax=Saccharothrix deserti TaxID=2593674 RepID=UPI00131D5663|nr:nucleotide disphospho-sugar-binding domain-containing protein [Saccharothrix deserti]
MRILFTILPASAHLYPVVSLAWAFQAAGHQVCLAAHSDVVEEATTVGLPAVVLGADDLIPEQRFDAEKARRSGEELNLSADERHLWDTVYDMMLPELSRFRPDENTTPEEYRLLVDDLVDFAKEWRPDLVLWDPTWVSSPVAARVAGAAHARLLWGPDMMGWARQRFVAAGASENPIDELVRPLAERHGVEVDDELVLGHWTIDQMPGRMRLPVDTLYVPMRPAPYNGAAPFDEWLYRQPERPRVCLTLGVTNRTYYKDSEERIARLLSALGDLDIEVVATLDESQLTGLPPIPDNVRTMAYVPLNQLLPTCSAVVHHGNTGTFTAALVHGVPQVIAVDEAGLAVTTAEFVAARGAGIGVDPIASSVEEIRKQVHEVVQDPSYAAGARALHDEVLNAPAPTDLVPMLERLTERHRARR